MLKKILIKKQKPENCPCRLCKVYIKNVGFLQNKKLCIISQDNILIIKSNIFRFRFFIFLFHQKFNLSTALQWQGVCYHKTLQVNFRILGFTLISTQRLFGNAFRETSQLICKAEIFFSLECIFGQTVVLLLLKVDINQQIFMNIAINFIIRRIVSADCQL